jgi:DNA-binding NtrC family response regulator
LNRLIRRPTTVNKSILLVTSETQPSPRQILADLGAIRISSATEATTRAFESPYDLVVVDDIPDTVELVEQFHDRYPKLPIVVLSADRSWQRAREAWRAGATDVVSKEPEGAELSQAVRRILGLTERSILLVDDDERFLDTWSKLLRDDGFSVATAASREGALQAMTSRSFGLAVVDLRLEQSGGESDMSGLEVAEAASCKGIATIILTAHPDFEALRSTLSPAADGRATAIDFVSKGEGFAALRNRIEILFARAEKH